MFARKRIIAALLITSFLSVSCAPKQAKEKKVVAWHWMNDRKDAINALAKKYKEVSGVTVEFKLFSPPDIYAQKVIAAARAGNLPEIFGVLGEKRTLASFIKAGYVVDLTPYMEADAGAWKNKFYPQTLGVVIFKNANNYGIGAGIYGVPIDTTVMQFVYNKTLFKNTALNPEEPPATFEQFISYAQKIKEKNQAYGFICGWGEGWLLNCLATEWAMNLLGEDKFLRTLKGEVPYTDEQWLQVFSLFEKLKNSAILAPNITTMINKEAEDAFSRDKAAFSFNGTWSVNVYKQLSPDLDYAFFPLPKVSDKFQVKIWGGSGSSFMVNANSSNKEEAIKFLIWLTDKEQQEFLIKETNNLPAIKGCEDSLPVMLKPLVRDLDNLTHPDIWPDNEDSRVLEVLNTGLQQIVMGLKSPQEVAKEIQTVKERISRR